jgi:hypothetical protein
MVATSRRVALVGEDMDAEGRAVQHLGVLAPVEQRLAYQAVDDRPEPAFRPCRSLGAPAQLVLPTGQSRSPVCVVLLSGVVCSAL